MLFAGVEGSRRFSESDEIRVAAAGEAYFGGEEFLQGFAFR
jgi:hypothetical protein